MKIISKALCLSFALFFTMGCSAQTINDYISHYNNLAPKLNVLAANKAQFMGQNFSVFSSALQNSNLQILNMSCHSTNGYGKKYFTLQLTLLEDNILSIGLEQQYQVPTIYVTFQNEIPQTIKSMVLQYHGVWNSQFENFFANMKIESIEFTGINGYNNPDRTPK